MYQRAGDIAANDLESVANTIGITGVLNSAGVRKKFLLPANGGLDKPRGQATQPTQDPQRQAQKRQSPPFAAFCRRASAGAVTGAQ